MYPYIESQPAFWNKKTEQVEVNDVELTERPTTLESILGTYCWFYSSSTNMIGEVDLGTGYITLENKSKAKATPAKISGSVQLNVHDGTFKGLKKAKEKKFIPDYGCGGVIPVDTGKYRKNFWEIKEIEWDKQSLGDGLEGIGFGACEVEDDNGNPFLKLEWGDLVGCHGVEEGFYVGKKVHTPSGGDEGDQEWELTDDEQVRLGIHLSETEVEELAKKGYISDSDGSDGGSVDIKSEDIINDPEETCLKRRLSPDEKEGIVSSEANKKARRA